MTRTMLTIYNYAGGTKPVSARIVVLEKRDHGGSDSNVKLYDEPVAIPQVARMENAIGGRFRVANDARRVEYVGDGRLAEDIFPRCNACTDFSACLEQGACRTRKE